jgi:Mg-chelatase subunit ChlD
MREQALALRRQPFERTSEEVFDVRLGKDVDRLCRPSSWPSITAPAPRLRPPAGRGRLLSYALRGADERGRGPMIVCLDGSGSMAGDKEIWSKAVALTLLEIARRQRRLFRFICFSSSETPLFTLDLNPRERHEVQEDRALDVAEYFPGGGTDFETPLSAAVDCLRAARYRRGDVVLITDGECQVAPDWLARFKVEKERLGFSLYSVLIDVGPSSLGTLGALSDRVTAVSKLADEACATSSSGSDGRGRLRGLRVLDLCDQTGAFAGKLLAGLGADVVLVEPPGGSPMRAIPPYWQGVPHPERSLFFWFYNAGKRSITLDPATADGAAPPLSPPTPTWSSSGPPTVSRRRAPRAESAARRGVDHAVRPDGAVSRLEGVGHGRAGDGRDALRERASRRAAAPRSASQAYHQAGIRRGRHRERSSPARDSTST